MVFRLFNVLSVHGLKYISGIFQNMFYNEFFACIFAPPNFYNHDAQPIEILHQQPIDHCSHNIDWGNRLGRDGRMDLCLDFGVVWHHISCALFYHWKY